MTVVGILVVLVLILLAAWGLIAAGLEMQRQRENDEW